MRDDNDFPKPVGMGGCAHQARGDDQRQCPVELAHWTPPKRFDALGALLVWHTVVRTMLEAGLFADDQSAGSHVQRRLKQGRYLGQQGLRLRFKGYTSVRVLPDLEHHKKVRSLDFSIGSEAQGPAPAAETRQLLKELPATVLLRRQELYVCHDELLLVSASPPVRRKGQKREGEQGQ